MDVLLSVIVFLLFVVVALLVLIYLRIGRQTERQIDAAEWLAADRRSHADAIATVFLGAVQRSLGALLRELQKAGAERRQLMAMATGESERHPASSASAEVSRRSLSAIPEPPKVPTGPLGDDIPTPRTPYSRADLLGMQEGPSL